MNITVTQKPKSTVELLIDVPYETYRQAEIRALKEISQHLKVDGFRSGHIPDEVIRQKITDSQLKEHTLNVVIPETYTKAVQAKTIVPIAQPQIKIQKWVEREGDTLTYTALVAVMPEVKLGDYRKIKVAREAVAITDSQVEEVIGQILDRFAVFTVVDRAAQKGDRVEIDFEGFDEKGTPVPGTQSKNHPVILGSQAFVPGFEEALAGVKKEDQKTFTVTFPKDYPKEAMRGQKVTFKATVHRVEEKALPELNEDTIEKITKQKQSPDAFRKQVEADLRHEMEARGRQAHEGKIIDEIIKITQAEIPEALMDEELKQLLGRHKQSVQRQGMDWESYLRHVGKKEEDFFKENRSLAEKNILARLGLQAILKEEKIEIADAAVQAKVEDSLQKYPKEQADPIRAQYKSGMEAYERLRNQLAADELMKRMTRG